MIKALVRFFIMTLWITGCTVLPERHHLIDLSAYPEAIQLNVPFYEQSDELCGPAAMAMVLDWNGMEVDLEQLHKQIYTASLGGSLQQDMLASARRHSMLATTIDNVEALLQELSQGTPVILLLNLGLVSWPKWHYVVVTGFNSASETAYIHDGQTAHREIPLEHLLQQWFRGNHWGLVVSSPDKLPQSADAQELLNAAIGLERANETEAAYRLYRHATLKFTTNTLLWLGRGNTAIALKKFDDAVIAFRQSIELDSHNGAAYHNLAATLFALGDMTGALEVILSGRENAHQFQAALSTLEQRIRNNANTP